ncbi:MAG: ATP-binding cassette domain-containing protein, partial [Lachnospiraceae bacterium]|nr:ATP-binding cassette domain-containing protein [Lachnospiraceae bacterium]
MENHTNIILKTEDLCKYYGVGDNQVKAVDHVNLEIRQGGFVSIIGKSGSGKSTLLHML